MPKYKIILLLILILSILPVHADLLAISRDEKSFLLMYFDEDELVVISTTRTLKSITRVAENVSIITDEDIEMMNAHTIADVLNTINGVQVSFSGGPGSIATSIIQGSELYHVAVFIDGILINNLSDNFAELGIMPVQNIAKIEIIKGPASSAWGSSLGGVINIITKTPGSGKDTKGVLRSSIGRKGTGDFRAELSGGRGNAGYYLYAGRLQADELTPGNDISNNSFYSKFSYNLSDDTGIIFTLSYNKSSRLDSLGQGFFDSRLEQLFTGLALNTSPGRDVVLNVALKSSKQLVKFRSSYDGITEVKNTVRDITNGISAQLKWKHGRHNLIIGTEYNDSRLKNSDYSDDNLKKRQWAMYANNTIVLGQLSITPGIRYDDISTSDNFVSPSLGITYALTKNTLARIYIAKGFNAPPLAFTSGDNEVLAYESNPDLRVEKIRSYQAGIETGELKYLWLKFSVFRHDIDNVIILKTNTDTGIKNHVNDTNQRRQGLEIEYKTLPFYNFMLSGGAIFIDTRSSLATKGVPEYSYDINLKYDDGKSFRALLKGHYIWWNEEARNDARYSSLIFDLNMIKNIFTERKSSMELFLSAHNIFNGSQYWLSCYENPARWIEAGVKIKF